ncbi:phosphoinositide phosphatase SAC4-like [Olea europaea var. sylvestris]|uniref:phosphoinositide phosphatase SAC4-like n=1 Tax=Olea europaea var. sylvestris TaxID=158386 RepID=UPI000C1D1568|nr:phosphoinositide phosphatase SAC4-like [Olea europaea var. sylvestris]
MADVLENVTQQPQGARLLSPPPLISPPPDGFMQKFRLYETRSKFYMVGRDKNRTYWKVLKIDRTEPSELNVREDSTPYTEIECSDLLRRIHEGNRVTGGLKFVTSCYGIVGFIKFLGPYYMLLITKRRQIGSICGHIVYAISKSEIIPLQNSVVRSSMVNYKNENRYKKLLCMVDLTKDFYFSYSYHVMRSLQKNMCDNETGQVLYGTMFVWNEFLTRGIHNVLQNTIWTVALVYGFFKQATISISGHDFKLTLIARRSRHYAGTSCILSAGGCGIYFSGILFFQLYYFVSGGNAFLFHYTSFISFELLWHGGGIDKEVNLCVLSSVLIMVITFLVLYVSRFLGHFQPQPGKADVWELDSDQHSNVGRNGQSNIDENGRSLYKRSLSDGNILRESRSPRSTSYINKGFPSSDLTSKSKEGSKMLSESSPEIATCESDLTDSRYGPSIPARVLFAEMHRVRCLEHENGDSIDSSNFVDLDWLSSSGNSCEDELLERSMLTVSPIAMLSSENFANEITGDTTPSTNNAALYDFTNNLKCGREPTCTDLLYVEGHNYEVLEEFSDGFVRWVNYGETLCH